MFGTRAFQMSRILLNQYCLSEKSGMIRHRSPNGENRGPTVIHRLIPSIKTTQSHQSQKFARQTTQMKCLLDSIAIWNRLLLTNKICNWQASFIWSGWLMIHPLRMKGKDFHGTYGNMRAWSGRKSNQLSTSCFFCAMDFVEREFLGSANFSQFAFPNVR